MTKWIASLALGALFLFPTLSFADCTMTTTGHDSESGAGLINQEIAMAFTPTCDGTLSTVKVYVSKTGSPADHMTLHLYDSGGSTPTGTSLAVSDTQDPTGSLTQTTFTFSDGTITSGAKMWIVTGRTGAQSNTDYYNIGWTAGGSGIWAYSDPAWNAVGRTGDVEVTVVSPSSQQSTSTDPTAANFIHTYGDFVLALCAAAIILAICKVLYDLFSVGGILHT